MKKRFLVLLTILFSLLFTSCLADILNDKFDFKVPHMLKYETEYGTIPQSKTFTGTYTLQEEDLPELSSGYSYLTFIGWYLDSYYSTSAQPGTTIDEDTTLYAKWSY